jgi:hypothetical protein
LHPCEKKKYLRRLEGGDVSWEAREEGVAVVGEAQRLQLWRRQQEPLAQVRAAPKKKTLKILESIK